jgi:hypothetical protein
MRILTAMLLAAPMALISIPTFAQQAEPEIEIVRLEAPEGDVDAGNARPWINIGVDPFRGDVAKGAEVLSAKTALNPSDVLEGARMRSLGLCHRYILKDGDQMRTTFDVDLSMLAQVSFAPGEPRGSDVCIVQRQPGAEVARAIVFPDGCTNVSAASAIIKIIRRDAPPLAKQEETPRRRGRGATMTTTPGAVQPDINQPFFGGIILFDGGGHTTTVQNGSASAAGSTSKSNVTTNGDCSSCAPRTHLKGE